MSTTIIQAVAGSGKTTQLKSTVEDGSKNEGLNKKEILCITFSRKLAKELRQEIRAYATVRTLHSLGFSLIKRNLSFFNYTKNPRPILNEEDRELFHTINKKVASKQILKDFYHQREALGKFNSTVCDKLDISEELGKKLAKNFRQAKQSRNVCSYSDMTRDGSRVYRAWTKDKNVRVVLPKLLCVDEYQDLNDIERQFVFRLIQASESSLIVGDDRQAIYYFRGATEGSIKKLAARLQDSHYQELDHSYRLTRETAELVNACPSKFEYPTIQCSRVGKKPLLVKASKREVGLDNAAKQIKSLIDQGVSPESIAVLTRWAMDYCQFSYFLVNHQVPINVSEIQKRERNILKHYWYFSKAVLDKTNEKLKEYLKNSYGLDSNIITEALLYKEGRIPHGKLGVDPETGRRIRETFNAVFNLRSNMCFDAFKRTFKESFQGKDIEILDDKELDDEKEETSKNKGFKKEDYFIGNILNRYGIYDRAKEKLEDIQGKDRDRVFLECLNNEIRKFLKNPKKDGVYLGTQHGAKGKAWDHVFLIDIFDLNKIKSWDKDLESNIFHVAVTRARERLYLYFFTEIDDNEIVKYKKKKMRNSLIRFLPEEDRLSDLCVVKNAV